MTTYAIHAKPACPPTRTSAPGGLEALLGLAGEATELTMFDDGPAAPPGAEALGGAAGGLDVVVP